MMEQQPKVQLRGDLESFPQHIFRAYDIRGITTTELTEAVVFNIGAALGSEVLSNGGNKIIVARDGRLSGPVLMEALQAGLRSTGVDVLDIGMVPTPVLYYATYVTDINSGVMLTGSHNPVDYNGLKMVVCGRSLTEDPIQRLYWRVKMGDVRQGEGQLDSQDLLPSYFQKISDTIKLERPMKIVVDAGNGIGAVTAVEVFERLGCEVIPMYCEVDGSFPNHHPDPSKPENLQELIAKVKAEKADIGFALDGDADRVGVVTPQGKIIWPDRQVMVFARDICQKQPGASIVYDVKCSRFVADVVKQAGGEPIMYRTGHSVIKNKMKQINAPFAGEMSGHLFFNDKWYGFDDGVYAAARMLEILAAQPRDADAYFAGIPEAVSTPELTVHIPDEKKFLFIDQLVKSADFDNAEAITIDGLRVEFSDGWGLVRASNTTPCIVLRFEADTEAALTRIQEKFRAFLLAHDQKLSLPF